MSAFPVRRLLSLAGLFAALASGCEAGARSERGKDKGDEPPAKKVEVGKNVFLEVQGKRRRVLVNATVCLREGPLELLMCRKQTKEHEAVLTADVDARAIHKALLLAGAVEGSPVRYQPKYRPATGEAIRVTLRYEEKGRQKTVPAQSWVKNSRTSKELDSYWVFAGSHLIDNPLDKGKKIYLANDGDVICVSNFESALLDLPIKSTKDSAELAFEAYKEHIPPVDTKVVVILEPVPDPKNKTK